MLLGVTGQCRPQPKDKTMNLNNGMFCYFPVRGDNGKVDVDATALAAKKAAEEFAAKDDPITAKLGEAAIKVWSEKKYSNLLHISTPTLARMAINALGICPDDKTCKDAAVRIQAVLAGQPDKFLVLKTGPHKGIHYKSRYTPAELVLITSATDK